MRNLYCTILLSIFLFNVSVFAQTSCGTVTGYSLTSTPIPDNPSQSSHVLTIYFTNSTSSTKGIEYWVKCANTTIIGPICYITQGGTSTSQTYSFLCATSNVITVPWIGYTSSSGGCGGSACGTIVNALNVPLPVDFKSINGLNKEKFNIIQWETASESNSHYFMVQKSTDGKSWIDMEKIESNSYLQSRENLYSVQDNEPYITTFYRIMHYDLDGSFSNSEIVKVARRNVLSSFAISPNPAQDVLNVNVPISLDNTDVNIQIINKSGRIVYEGVEANSFFGINVDHLLPDVYVVKVIIQNEVFMKQFIKI